jgi:hypothetical protein
MVALAEIDLELGAPLGADAQLRELFVDNAHVNLLDVPPERPRHRPRSPSTT